jgi:chromosome transmission fidelity protein 1
MTEHATRHCRISAEGKARQSGGCGFRAKDDSAMDKFVDDIASGAMDIEDLAKQGQRRAVCPYYAAREAVLKADFVLVPYSCLIHRCAFCCLEPSCE